MKNKGKTYSLKKTVLLFLGALPVIVILFYVKIIFLWVIIDNPFSLPKQRGPCGATESDAKNIAVAIADYFSLPEHTTLPTISGASVYLDYNLSAGKSWQNIAWVSGDPLNTITIVVKDGSGRCPKKNMKADPNWDHINSTYTLIID